MGIISKNILLLNNNAALIVYMDKSGLFLSEKRKEIFAIVLFSVIFASAFERKCCCNEFCKKKQLKILEKIWRIILNLFIFASTFAKKKRQKEFLEIFT